MADAHDGDTAPSSRSPAPGGDLPVAPGGAADTSAAAATSSDPAPSRPTEDTLPTPPAVIVDSTGHAAVVIWVNEIDALTGYEWFDFDRLFDGALSSDLPCAVYPDGRIEAVFPEGRRVITPDPDPTDYPPVVSHVLESYGGEDLWRDVIDPLLTDAERRDARRSEATDWFVHAGVRYHREITHPKGSRRGDLGMALGLQVATPSRHCGHHRSDERPPAPTPPTLLVESARGRGPTRRGLDRTGPFEPPHHVTH